MDAVEDIPNAQFFSIRDAEGFVYGFDLMSLFNLFEEDERQCLCEPFGDTTKNPFSTKPLGHRVYKDMCTLLRLARLHRIPICIQLESIDQQVSATKAVELDALYLFQKINALGNYADAQWFMSLNLVQLITFYYSLVDIWNWRAGISLPVKRAVCPPLGNPFALMPGPSDLEMMVLTDQLDILRTHLLQVIFNLVCTGFHSDCQGLGAMYVLGSLTLVNPVAADAMPWFYQSFVADGPASGPGVTR